MFPSSGPVHVLQKSGTAVPASCVGSAAWDSKSEFRNQYTTLMPYDGRRQKNNCNYFAKPLEKGLTIAIIMV
jgi:hypothetical protein